MNCNICQNTLLNEDSLNGFCCHCGTDIDELLTPRIERKIAIQIEWFKNQSNKSSLLLLQNEQKELDGELDQIEREFNQLRNSNQDLEVKIIDISKKIAEQKSLQRQLENLKNQMTCTEALIYQGEYNRKERIKISQSKESIFKWRVELENIESNRKWGIMLILSKDNIVSTDDAMYFLILDKYIKPIEKGSAFELEIPRQLAILNGFTFNGFFSTSHYPNQIRLKNFEYFKFKF